MVARLVPLLLALGLFAFFGWRLANPSQEPAVTSQLVGKAVPPLSLPPVLPGKDGIELPVSGAPYLLNLFGSWCIPCIEEAPQLEAIAASGVTIDAIAVRDEADAVAQFLERHGDPFVRLGDDPGSEAMLALGATGVPETFLVGSDGIIRAHWQGPIMADDVDAVLAAVEAAR